MKIPKYVQKLIDRRYRLAIELSSVCTELDCWIEAKGIPANEDYTWSGCLIYCEPSVAKDCIEQDILNYNKEINDDQ